MAQQIRALASKHDELSSILGTYNFGKLSSLNLDTCIEAPVHTYTNDKYNLKIKMKQPNFDTVGAIWYHARSLLCFVEMGSRCVILAGLEHSM